MFILGPGQIHQKMVKICDKINDSYFMGCNTLLFVPIFLVVTGLKLVNQKGQQNSQSSQTVSITICVCEYKMN
uniref:Uncharacterized protein n=1 Tax=Anguilla anguilla TaxID=7936 RepID=A0A0E9UV14_ANGAN